MLGKEKNKILSPNNVTLRSQYQYLMEGLACIFEGSPFSPHRGGTQSVWGQAGARALLVPPSPEALPASTYPACEHQPDVCLLCSPSGPPCREVLACELCPTGCKLSAAAAKSLSVVSDWRWQPTMLAATYKKMRKLFQSLRVHNQAKKVGNKKKQTNN